MRRMTYMMLAGLLAVSVLTGCKGGGTGDAGQSVSEQTESETVVEETPVTRSLASTGNNYRLKAVLEKIQAGEEVKIGFIGGSITEGYNAGTGDIFAKLVTEYLDTAYGDGSGKVTYVNAGLSGTPSMLGLIRSERDMLYAEPDLIFIEFAVNDAQTFTDKQAYESLIRKCLEMENDPAVVLLYSITKEGYTCQDIMAQTAFYYSLPAVSVKNAINPEIEAGTMTWADWSNDEAHPNPNGHQMYSRFIEHLIDTLAAEETDEEYVIPERLKYGKDWSGMSLYDSENLEVTSLGEFTESSAHGAFSNSFSYTGTEGAANEGMSFTAEGHTLFIVYKATTAASYGTAEILVDGEVVAHLAGCQADGWNNPVTQLIYSEDESGTHEITIRMQAGDEGKNFDVLAVGMSE